MAEADDAVSLLLDFARNGDSVGLAELFRHYSVDVNAKGVHKKNYSWTALHLASYFGHEDAVKLLLEKGADVNVINMTGDSPLHKAVLSNRVNVVRHLLSAGADVNLINADGKTAKDLSDSDDIIAAIDAAQKSDLLKKERKLLDAAREGDVDDIVHLVQQSQQLSVLSDSTSKGNISPSPSSSSLSYQKNVALFPSINCADSFGNRPLHYATLAGNRETVIILLQLGADPLLSNKRGLRPADLSRDPLIKELLEVKSLKEMSKNAKRVEGLLLRKSRIRGSREHWIVLESGTLSLYVNKEAERSKKREKSGRFLAGSKIEGESAKDTFILRFSNKSKLMFSVPKGESVAFERQKWINAFKDHIEHANKLLDSELMRAKDDEEIDDFATLGSLQSSIENIRAYDQLLRRQLEDISKLQTQLRQEHRTSSGISPKLQECIGELDNKVSHLVGLSNQMCSDLSSCVNVLSQREELYRKEIDEEKRRNKILEESLQAVAREAKHLETSLQTIRSNSFRATSMEQLASSMSKLATKAEGDSEESGDETAFFDCPSPEVQPGSPSHEPDSFSFKQAEFTITPNGGKSELEETVTVRKAAEKNRRMSEHGEDSPTVFEEHDALKGKTSLVEPIFKPEEQADRFSGRKVLPVTMFSRKVSVWTILKHCIGKDLSRITMPIVLNEPLTFLQKQAEYFEYSELLHKALALDNPVDRMEYVAAFVISTISSSVERIAKPFNPLLGETYELTRPELGFRICNEQVSHHPPISAYYAESVGRTDGGFKVTGSMCPKIRFWGKSVEIQPKGLNTLELVPFKEVFSWETVKVVCHNIIIGKIWLEYQGRCELTCHTNGLRCLIDFKPAGWFGELHRIEGVIVNEKNEKLRAIYGKWTEAVFSVPIDVWTAFEKGASKSNGRSSSAHTFVNNDSDGAGSSVENLEDGGAPQSSPCDLHLEGQKLLWSAIPIPEYCNDYFNFSLFAMQLNEPPTPELRAMLPRTDSRLRPDLRLLEDGDIDRAAAEKHRLEEKQRMVRKKYQEKKQEWTPLWFKEETNKYTKATEWQFNGEYWKRDFTKCPDIFEP